MNFILLLIYMLLMGAGLVFCNYVLKTPYNTTEFSEKFLPVMIILAVMVLIYALKNRKKIDLITENKKGYLWFGLIFVPLICIAIYSGVKSFDKSLLFFIVIFDSMLIGIAEEGMYRWILLGGLLRKMKPVRAILISALLFSSLHLLNILGGIEFSEVVNQLFSTFFMGIFLGLVYLDTKNILFPMLFHFVWDYIMLTGAIEDSPIQSVVIFGTIAFELAVSVILMIKFKKILKNETI